MANGSATWHTACALLRPGVRTLWEVLEQARPGIRTACVDEPIDRGATYATFDLVRAMGNADGAKSLGAALPDPRADVHATQEWVQANPDYAWSTQVDAMGLVQLLEQWSAPDGPAGRHVVQHDADGLRAPRRRPALGPGPRRPHRQRPPPRRVARPRGVARPGWTAWPSCSPPNHGMVGGDPAVRGDWDTALTAAGIPFRDEAYGWIYLG